MACRPNWSSRSPTDVVRPGRAIDLRLVAETIDVDVDTLRSLNPVSVANGHAG